MAPTSGRSPGSPAARPRTSPQSVASPSRGGSGHASTTLSSSSSSSSSSSTSWVRGPLSLPLLEGLVHRPGMADQIVQSALTQWRCGTKISNALARHWKRRQQTLNSAEEVHHKNKRRRTSQALPQPTTVGRRAASVATPCIHHWLLQSLCSTSAPERKVAVRLFAMGCPVNPHSLWELVQVLMSLLQQQTPTPLPPEATVVLVALLKHILFQTNTYVTQSKVDSCDKFALAFVHHKTMGLTWIAKQVWRLASTDNQCNSHNPGGRSIRNPTTRHKTYRGRTQTSTVTASWVDLLHRLLLTGTNIDTLEQAHGLLWKEEHPTELLSVGTVSSQMSTLACLVATYHYWKELRSSMLPSEKQVLQVLKQLVDPHTMPSVKTSTTTNTTNSSTRGRDGITRPTGALLDSFFRFSGAATKTTATARSTSTDDALRLIDTLKETSSEATKTNQTNSNPSTAMAQSPSRRTRTSTASTSRANAESASSPSHPTLSLFSSGSSSAADRSNAAAAVAQIFSAVYGGDSSEPNSPEGNSTLELFRRASSRNSRNNNNESSSPPRRASASEAASRFRRLISRRAQNLGNHRDANLFYDLEDLAEIPSEYELLDFGVDRDEDPPNRRGENDGDEEEAVPHEAMDLDPEDAEDTEDDEVGAEDEHDDHHGEEDDDDDEDRSHMDHEDDDDENHEVKDNRGDDDDDEEVESDEECESDNDDEEHDIVIHEGDDLSHIEHGFFDLPDMEEDDRLHSQGIVSGSSQGLTSTSAKHTKRILERKQVYLRAAMEVLSLQHPSLRMIQSSSQGNMMSLSILHRQRPLVALPCTAEQELVKNVLHIVSPPKKPLNTKIIMRRAPTQEEFFRGSLSKNPISLNMLKKDGNAEATMKDLRQHIAKDLQMADSAELLELLVGNKIIDIDLKIRVVHQVVWKNHLMQSSGSSGTASALSALSGITGRGPGRSLISTGSGLSMIFSTGALGGGSGTASGSGAAITEDTPLSALPPMVVTYRLTGVDGEATEDTVSSLEDPEAPSQTADPKEVERRLEKQFGISRLVTQGRGVFCLLRSIEADINMTLAKIRRDEIGGGENASRKKFKKSSPPPCLVLLSCCSKLPSNRRLLLRSRAPTILLRLLLDVLHALEGEGLSESNHTAKALKELIETLASDMLSSNGSAMSETSIDQETQDLDQDASTLRLLIGAIESSTLSSPLRNVIAKLLPYLTYGQPSLSKELASEFNSHVDLEILGDYQDSEEDRSHVLMSTFVHASMSLPANEVCNSLRTELVKSGFVEGIASFLLRSMPAEPPSWSTSLWAKGDQVHPDKKVQLENQWKRYLERKGLKVAFDMLTGLVKNHPATQLCLGSLEATENHPSLVVGCHWIEATSDNSNARIEMSGLGLAAETLLDELMDDNSPVTGSIKATRRKTKDRKKEIAMERRNKALNSMNSFGVLKPTSAVAAASALFPVLGGNTSSQPKRRKKESPKAAKAAVKPAWMAEMENIEDETGCTCSVCQEGRTLQPSELLGLYAYVKKVSVPTTQCGGRNHIDGTNLLLALPSSLPRSLNKDASVLKWHGSGLAAATELKDQTPSTLSSLASSRRATYFTTTVSAGNAIHMNCHNKARQADRNHPKAPKSEWEGASLRNSRVNCNVILPLVSSRSSKVPLVAVDMALTEHQTAISNLLGARPKSMLWNILHDVRFLMLRMAYGEALNTDCGGGSLASNAQLIFHQLLMADMFEKDAQVDATQIASHARNLSGGFLAASSIIRAKDYNHRSESVLHRELADSAAMASLTCILFHNTSDDLSKQESDEESKPHQNRRWIVGKENFLRGLLKSAGRRHALGVEDSGCITSRTSGSKRDRSSSFAEWDAEENNTGSETMTVAPWSRTSSISRSRSKASVDDFRNALRPMIVLYAMMDQLSMDFVPALDDEKIEETSGRLVKVIEECHGSKGIHELLKIAKVPLDPDEIIGELQKGMVSA